MVGTVLASKVVGLQAANEFTFGDKGCDHQKLTSLTNASKEIMASLQLNGATRKNGKAISW